METTPPSPDDLSVELTLPELSLRPRHVAIIMDGNGRWATTQGFARIEGHRRGADVVRDITTYCCEIGVEYLTLYSFSVQNWQRPDNEVSGLMALLEDYCRDERDTLMENGVRLTTIGRTDRLPPSTLQAVTALCQETEQNTTLLLTLALDYGGREELVSTVQTLAAEVERGERRADSIDEAVIQRGLNTSTTPDPDLVIRTSGELRISNFLLWQIAYAELFFTDVYWPDFSRADFATALREYAGRQRRFGGITDAPDFDGVSLLEESPDVDDEGIS